MKREKASKLLNEFESMKGKTIATKKVKVKQLFVQTQYTFTESHYRSYP